MATFGRYEILDKLGEGAMGIVYRAQDRPLGRVVALKMLSAEDGSEDELQQRFHREVEAVGRLNHPNVVTVYDMGQSEGHLYMAMELLEGEDLRSLIERNADVALGDRVRILMQIADGLAYAHSRQVVHRDIKPANIFVTTSGLVKILDFGLARLPTLSTITRRGVILGTPDYMSPEQAMGKSVDHRSDVFSAGGVFYEFVTRDKPFKGKTLHSVLYQIISEQPDPVLTLNPELPARLAAVVHWMLRKDPEQRPQSMDLVARELKELHTALRRTRCRSTLTIPQVSLTEEARARLREHLSRGRAHYESGSYARALPELNDALTLDPDSAEAAELLWRAQRAAQSGRPERPALDPATAARVAGLLLRAGPSRSDAEARRALAELALIAPDDPRVVELVRERVAAGAGRQEPAGPPVDGKETHP